MVDGFHLGRAFSGYNIKQLSSSCPRVLNALQNLVDRLQFFWGFDWNNAMLELVSIAIRVTSNNSAYRASHLSHSCAVCKLFLMLVDQTTCSDPKLLINLNTKRSLLKSWPRLLRRCKARQNLVT